MGYNLSTVRTAVLIVGALLSSACGDEVDKTLACELGEVAASAATMQDRKAIGVAAPYVPDLGLAAREVELEGSIAARRAAAWEVVRRALAPVPLGDPRLAANFPGTGQPQVPAWHTWYARDDFERVFKKEYRDLGPEGRAARAPLDVADGLAWNAVALDDVPEWPEQRYLDYLATIDTDVEAQGTGGASRVGYSPGALSRLLGSYNELHQCRLVDPPAAFATDPVRDGRRVVETDTIEVEKCGWRVLGPFQAAPGEEVLVTTRGAGDADIYVRRGAAPDAATYDCKSSGDDASEACSVDGGGPVYVAVFGASEAAASIEVDVEYTTADVVDPTCLDGAMPRDAVVVKADWRRQLTGDLLPIYDTSGPRMTARFEGAGEWNADGAADPQADAIYTVELPSSQQRFRLPGLHVVSKELDHWMWISLWWSPNPDTDFGADRPASIAQLPGPWKNYKMCVATSYVETDPDARGGFAGGLGDSLDAVNGGVGTPSWCSNPYIEAGKDNARTNCIGCHQHGGTELTAEHILEVEPRHGVTRTRNNFFTDYLWAVKGGGGDDLSSIIQAEIDYWDAND